MVLQPRNILAACLAALCLVCSCRRQEQKTIVARVGKEVLTLEEVQSQTGGEVPPAGEELRRIINHWINEELLYQEAQRRGFDGTEQFTARMQETRRHLLAQVFLDSQFNDTSGIADSVLHAYYAKHSQEFVVRNDMVRLNAARFLTREKANAFASLVTRGMSWTDAFTAASHDTGDRAAVLPGVSGQYVSQHEIFPPELWKVAASLALGDVSFPVNTVSGYCIIQPLARLSAGSPASFDVAADEIRARVRIEQRQQQYEELLGTLRKRYSVDINVPAEHPTDTLHDSHD